MTQATTIREQALQLVKARLSAPGSPASKTFRSNLDQIAQADLPCFDFTPGDEKIEDPGEFGDRNSVTRTQPLTVRAIIAATAQTGQPVEDSDLDPFQTWAEQALSPTDLLGGVVNDIETVGGPTVYQPGGADLIGRELNFVLKYATKRGDPTQKG